MANKEYRLTEVVSAKERRKFLDFPKRLYKGCKEWVCPIDETIEKIFDPSHNVLFKGGDACRWLVLDGDNVVVGRIAAFYNEEKSALEEQPTGGCGFFDAINDQEVANMLFDASREWLAARGQEAMDGPINFGQRDSWWGVLVDGFEYDPLFENPYNYPYYKDMFESYGFQNYFNQYTYQWIPEYDDVNSLVTQRARRLEQTPGYSFKTIDMSRLDEATENFRTIYNKAWAIFSGVKPMTPKEAKGMMNMLKPIIDPDIIFFAYFNGEPIGFYIMVPDLNKIIGRFNGKFGWWQKIQLMWELKVKRSSDRIFGIIFAVTPEFRGKGVESGIMQAVLDQYMRTPKNKYKSAELAWMGDFNPVMNRMVEQYVGATRHKTHTTYRYLFDRTKEFKRCPKIGMVRQTKE